MLDRKTFGQFCALARALDRVGDRWTLLIVRELLLEPARYGELRDALPGLATNLLALRLRQLEADGLLEHIRSLGASHATYRLTPHGRALEPVLLAFIRWGAGYMATGPGADVVDERWAFLALRALLATDQVTASQGEVRLHCGTSEFAVRVQNRTRQVVAEPSRQPRAEVTAPLPALLSAVANDDWTPEVRIEGDAAFARAALRPLD